MSKTTAAVLTVAVAVALAATILRLTTGGAEPRPLDADLAPSSEQGTSSMSAGPRRTPAAQGAEPADSAEPRPTRPDDCLALAERAQVVDCLLRNSTPNGIPPQVLAQALCSKSHDRETLRAVAREAAGSWPAHHLARNLVTVVESCGSHSAADTLVGALADLCNDPAADPFLARFKESLTSRALFDETGSDALMRLVHGLSWAHVEARERLLDARLTTLMRSAAVGNEGGTFEQIDRAIQVSSMLLADGTSPADLVESVLSSDHFTHEAARSGIGATLGGLLLSSRFRESGPAARELEGLMELLVDPVFGTGAALQIVSYGARESPPAGVERAAWHGIWDRAQEVAAVGGTGR